MKDTVSHYVPPYSPLTSTEPQALSNNLTMPSSATPSGSVRPVNGSTDGGPCPGGVVADPGADVVGVAMFDVVTLGDGDVPHPAAPAMTAALTSVIHTIRGGVTNPAAVVTRGNRCVPWRPFRVSSSRLVGCRWHEILVMSVSFPTNISLVWGAVMAWVGRFWRLLSPFARKSVADGFVQPRVWTIDPGFVLSHGLLAYPSAKLVGLARHTEEMATAAVGARQPGGLAVAGEQAGQLRVTVVKNRHIRVRPR
jgi:hypothetical protein